MDLTTNYLGLSLAHPIMTGASPLVEDMDVVKKLEDAGAAAIVMHSLFEEQIEAESRASQLTFDRHHNAYSEAMSFFPDPSEYHLGPRAWLDQLRKIKRAVKIPVIGSLNGTTGSGWVRYAKSIEDAGADALELNVYLLATNVEVDGQSIEDRVIEVATAVRAATKLPLAVKLSPFYSSLPNLVRRLEGVGVNGVVLFNRFLQPDIDIEELEVKPKLVLSTSNELLMRLRWLAILHGRVGLPLACTGGVHTSTDAVKALMAGAQVVQVVSSLMKHGPAHIGVLRDGLAAWMTQREYTSIDQLRGSMSLKRCPDPEAFERANYAKLLTTWKGMEPV
jgi:dihydroorotate dehydrogenase (fumarate)